MTIFPTSHARKIGMSPPPSVPCTRGKKRYATASMRMNVVIFPVTVATKLNSVRRCACRRLMRELFMSQKSVKNPVIATPVRARELLYHGRKNAITTARKIITIPISVRRLSTFAAIFSTLFRSSICSEISRTAMV